MKVRYSCECGKIYTHQSNLKTHKLSNYILEKNKIKYSCECGKTFTHPCTVKTHKLRVL